jgi:hypothetical protein
LLNLVQAQQRLLAQYGLANNITQPQQVLQAQQQHFHNNRHHNPPPTPPGFSPFPAPQAHLSATVHQTQQSASSAQQQVPQVSQHSPGSFAGYNGQETLLPQAFNTLTLQDLGDVGWNMDTGASSHLNSNANNLSTIYNKSIYPSVFVGNGNSIPVTNTGHSLLPNPHRPLHLHNVLITSHIVKNLIYVRQFTRDNKVSIDFDEFGFSVKDYLTRQILLRCDSTGDLYPVTTPTSYPQAFLASHHTWHQRLGHPGNEVLRSLLSDNSILCNKVKSPQLCHACQLGKHVRLPFHVSDTVVNSVFDIVHSDLWTSPLPSQSGIKYYVIFLDHFSHYLWVYPLRNKSDTFAKFVEFRSLVKTQFNAEIKAFQCDHGGEFDNTIFHQLFTKHGIHTRFSCPRTSQQNGKSERMIRTINNLIRTLLFQAHLPPHFWVEALHMATYLLNILPSTAINNDTPHFRLYNTKPNYTYLRVFGCLCYAHVDTNHKLGPRSTPCIFLGYPSNHRGFRCLNLSTNKIIISRSVTFDETIFPYGSVTPNDAPSYTFLDTTPNIIPRHILQQPNSIISTHNPHPTSPNPSTPSHITTTDTTQLQSTQTNTSPENTTPGPTSTVQPNPPPPPVTHPTDPNTCTNPTSTHPMVTRFQVGTNKKNPRYNCHVSTISPIPKSHVFAIKNPNWQRAMLDEYNALIKNNTWVLVPRPF